MVAPRAGAWVETADVRGSADVRGVAPRAGAWVETTIKITQNTCRIVSHPVRVRGLKQR